MKKLYQDFFFIPKTGKGKVSEKAMIFRIALSIFVMIVCMMAISLTAYAYFSVSEISGYTTVKSATWELDITEDSGITPTDGIYTLDNTAGTQSKIFTFTLKKKNTYTTAKYGYAKIEIKTDIDGFTSFVPYYTQPIGDYTVNAIKFKDEARSFSVAVPKGKCAIVKITPEWGSCSLEAIANNQIITPLYGATAVIENEQAETNPQTENTQNTGETEQTPDTDEAGFSTPQENDVSQPQSDNSTKEDSTDDGTDNVAPDDSANEDSYT